MPGNFEIGRSDYPYISHSKVFDILHELDVKCAVKEGRKIVERAKRQDKKAAKRFKKKQEEKKPFWFKKITFNQVAAANMIFSALQQPGLNDQLCCITYIVVNGLRLKKPPTEQQLLAAIEFARRSDLAFLWYLYKAVYKSADEICNQKKFTHDERVILSSICHLDMMVTLRQLDKILPQPVDESGKKIFDAVKILTPGPALRLYEKYKDKFFIIENQANRWFEQDYLVPSKNHCWAQRLITEKVKDAASQKVETKGDAICTSHAAKSSKLNKFLDCLRRENIQEFTGDKNLNHLSNFERKIACEIDSELQTAEREMRQWQEGKDTQIINSAFVNQLVDDAFNRRFLHLCTKCENPPSRHNSLQLRDRPTSYDPKAVQYFHRASINSDSFKFDYDKIFSPHFLHADGGRDAVKKSINAALELNKYLTVDNAITACLRDMWRAKLREWNEQRQAEMEERQQRVVADCRGIGGDKERLFALLRQGIALMRKNPKFVLAALPHAHRLPILKEWMLQRYGVKYVYEDCIWGI